MPSKKSATHCKQKKTEIFLLTDNQLVKNLIVFFLFLSKEDKGIKTRISN